MLLRKFSLLLLYIYLNILNTHVSCYDGSTLAFAIDDTRSMYGVIDQVKQQASEIINTALSDILSDVKDFVLVTINDPDVILRTKTSSPKEFQYHINRIRVHNRDNDDCEERTLTGIQKALLASRPGSYLFVFTDASAKDYDRVQEIKVLCQRKQIQVLFVLTGDCGNPHDKKFKVYHEIAKASSGQVFRIENGHVGQVLEVIKTLLKGRHSVIKWATLPRSPNYVAVPFTIDEESQYVLVSTTGKNVYIRVSSKTKHQNGPQPTINKITWNDNAKVLELKNLQPGEYYAWVKGDSESSLVIYEKSNFTFEHGFSMFEPKSMNDTTKQPIAGNLQHLSINVTDPENKINVETALILDMDDKVLKTLPLRKVKDDLYITNDFVPPNQMFKIKVQGKVKKTGKKISRLGKTPIEPTQIIDNKHTNRIPYVEISEGPEVSVDYDSKITLTCKVSADQPIIQWFTSNGTQIATKSAVMEQSMYISYLHVVQARKNDTFTCRATNRLKKSRSSKIHLIVRPTFDNVPAVQAPIAVAYGKDGKIKCGIHSSQSMKIKWFWGGKEVKDSPIYSISSDGSELTLKSMDLGMDGKYTCEAYLEGNPTVTQKQDVFVNVTGLEQPVIETSNNNLRVTKGQNVELKCRIVSGVPKPHVRWLKKYGNNYVQVLHENKETLVIPQTQLKHAGQYKCEAGNVLGIASQTIDVYVRSRAPEVKIDKTDETVPYGSDVEFTCNVEAEPPLTVVWTDEKGSIVQTKVTNKTEHEFTNKLKIRATKSTSYICVATSNEGSTSQGVDVTVLSPIDIQGLPKGSSVVKYGEDSKIRCNVKSSHELTIKWFKSGKELRNSAVYAISADGLELTLKSVDLGIDGKYSCEASLRDDPSVKKIYVTDVEITGLEHPNIEPSNRNLEVKNGENLTLICKIITGKPEPQVKWYKKNGLNFELIPNENRKVLLVSNAEFKDAGKYKCKAINVIGTTSAEFDVNVNGKPKITIAEKKRTVPYNTDIDLLCNVESRSAPTVVWKDEKGTILQNEVTHKAEHEFTNALKLRATKSTSYICVATNNEGTTTQEVNVTVLSPIDIQGLPKGSSVVKYGEDSKIRCNVKSSHPLSIKWFRSGRELSNSAVYAISADGLELTLKRMDLGMEGKYSCEASLRDDPYVKKIYDTDVEITGLEYPNIEPSNRNLEVNNGKNFTIICKIITGKPEPQVKWYKKNGLNFELIPNENRKVLLVSNAEFKDAGKYKCKASNVIGTTSAEFDVNVNGKPKITITEKNITVPYNSDTDSICNVESGSAPTIVWKDEKGTPFHNKIEKVSDYGFVYVLKLHNLKKSAGYVCEASNNMGFTTTYINVTVLSPFDVHDHIPDTTKASYGTEKTLTCDIDSALAINIRWYLVNNGLESTKSLIQSSDKYTILRNGKELKINFVDMDTIGKYTCEASLESEPKEVVTYNTNVEIADLAPPVIGPTNKITNVIYGESLELKCKIIGGHPKPQVQWFKKKNHDFEPMPTGNKEILIIPKATFKHAGQYKCEAKNVKGTATAQFNITINSKPQITIPENKMTVPYGSDVEISCKVESQLPLTVVWKDEKESILQDKSDKTSDYESVNKMKLLSLKKSAIYICAATNEVGIANEEVNVTVLSPFDVHEHIKENTGVPYGKEKILKCDVNSTLPITIKWYRQNGGLNSSKTLIQSSDQHSILHDGIALKIKSVDLHAVGTYTCEASLVSDPTERIAFSTDVDIVDLAAPVIGPTNKSANSTIGEAIELNCNVVSGKPTPQVQWYEKDGLSFVPMSHENDEVLKISKAQFKHAGQYKCEAKNVKGTESAEFDVNINSKPQISITKSKEVVPYGSDVDLTCKVESQPSSLLTVMWKGEKKTHATTEKISDYKTSYELKLENIKKSAVYVCTAANNVGTSSEQVNVTVLSPFNVYEHIKESTGVSYGTENILRCNINSTLPMTINWYRESDEWNSKRTLIRSSSKHSILNNGTELKIKLMNLDTIGTYTCEAVLVSDPTETVAFSTEVNIVDLASPVLKPTVSGTNLTIGEDISLNCGVISGQPAPQIQWFRKNGINFDLIPHENGEVLKISKIEFKHAGLYKCEAKNVKGTVSAQFDIKIHSLPQISFPEINKIVPYDSDEELTCKVESQPLPLTVVWKDEKGSVLSKEFENTSFYESISKLKLKSLKKSGVYICAATNNEGIATEQVNVTVLAPFDVHEKNSMKDTTEVKYGSEKTLRCDINSTYPMTIRWYRQNSGSSRTLIHSSDKYTLLHDGIELKIKAMDLELMGTYTCEASLLSNPKESVQLSTNVNIVDLAPPVIEPSIKNTNSTLEQEIKLNCKIISGQPKPKVQWYKKKGSNYELIVQENQEVLLITKVQFKHAGLYKCEVKNAIETVSANFNINVKGKPVITLVETEKTVPYGSDVEVTCKVDSQPPVTVVWKDEKENLVQDKTEKYADYEFGNKLKLKNLKKSAVYVCAATNNVGSSTEYINITMLSPFEVHEHVKDTTGVKYGTEETLRCDIDSTLPIKIKWYRQNSGLKSSRTLIHSSDKYTLVRDGKELKIKLDDLNLIGTYTCEASLVSDPNETVKFRTDVNVVDLAAPVLKSTKKSVNVAKDEKLKINCGIISGIPKPHVQWYRKTNDGFVPISDEKKEELVILNTQFKDAGQYKCEAKNVKGTVSAEFDVNVNSKPEITIIKTDQIVPYGSDVDFTCKAESQPPFTVLWTDKEGSLLQNKTSKDNISRIITETSVVKISEYEFGNRLTLHKVNKSAVYTCVATNIIGNTMKYVNLTVLSPFDVQNHIEGTTRIKYGTEKILQCDIKSSQSMEIQWYYKNSKSPRTLISASDKYSILHDGAELKINNMDMDTIGQYICEASLQSNPEEKIAFSTDVIVDGLARPEISYSSYTEFAKNVTIVCRFNATPEPTIKWLFKPIESDKFTTIPGSNEELTIFNIKPEEFGIYKCYGSNHLGEIWRVFDVVVQEPPEITNNITNYYGVVSDKAVVISCNATGYPNPTIVWTKEGNTQSDGFTYNVKGNTIYVTNLVETTSEVNFKCSARNKLDTVTQMFSIEVTEIFEDDSNYYGHTEDIFGLERSMITIPCKLVNPETRSVRWYKNGIITNQTGIAYEIVNASPLTDNGNYTCRVNTDEGCQHETYVLDIGKPPTFYNNDVNTNVDWNQDARLNCEVNAQPAGYVKWSFNGNKLESLNNVHIIDVMDWGEYTCYVSNVHGSIQRTFNVFTSGCYIRKSMDERMPLIFEQETQTWPDSISSSSLILRKGETIQLACSSKTKSNAFRLLPAKTEVTAQCLTQDQLVIDGETYKYNNLQCEAPVEPFLLKTHEHCAGQDSETIRVGFAVNGFVEAYSVCFNTTSNVPLYANIPKDLTQRGAYVKESVFKWRTATGLDERKSTGYTCKRSNECCYGKGQLLSVNELPFGPAQAATFTENINSVNIYKPCIKEKRTSWDEFEKYIGSTKMNYETWSSWNGASKYEVKNHGLVPRYLWKVMNYEGISSAMVYVNDDSPDDSDILCTQPCETMMSRADKYLYCCNSEEFSKVFGISFDNIDDVQST